VNWTAYKVRDGKLIKLGTVAAPHQPAAIRAAWDRWPAEIDPKQVQAGFTVRQEPEK
jgi:hypothetical protein